MNKGDLLRCIGILTYVVLTIIDRFCFNIAICFCFHTIGIIDSESCECNKN